MTNARDRRREYVRGLEEERAAPSLAHEPQHEIAVPEEEGERHGQFVVAINPQNGQTAGFNFRALDGGEWRGEESIREAADTLASILAGETPWVELTAPADGQLHILTRAGAERVIGVCEARSKGRMAPRSTDPRVRLVPAGAIPGVTRFPG